MSRTRARIERLQRDLEAVAANDADASRVRLILPAVLFANRPPCDAPAPATVYPYGWPDDLDPEAPAGVPLRGKPILLPPDHEEP